ncbi:kinase-interacting protein 1-like [Andrographis paniculata]|uniref:kinase-interacting protein 1-like n=1 Tax=Andrographis paniculata TaxID=175694 RepID=UPI0021E922AC|nr:kinase-interacting protein 1-like [Andrographis paniculata]
MLQRAASNAYSWWWAGHIRTKQSKWLEQCLRDMEEKVHEMLTMIEQDGDSFAKRAEMYYKRRPELINSVEEAFKAFRSLADRYDMLSKDLQNANHTIATVFPDQVQFGFEDDDDFPMSKLPNPITHPVAPPDIPQVPNMPSKDFKRAMSAAAKQLQAKKSLRARSLVENEEKPGLTRDKALEEINKLQKEILSLQTVKEFVKCSYESGVAKYWDIENEITTMQKRVSRLQDEFDIGSIIDDNEARTLMAETALKSCQEMLVAVHEKQEKMSREAREEYERIEAAYQRLQSIRERYLQEKTVAENSKKDVREFESVVEKGQEDGSDPMFGPNMTVSEMAEKIDKLVSKVIGLEATVSSQTVLVDSLRSETDNLNTQIQTLEDEENRAKDTEELRERVRKVEEQLSRAQDLNENVQSQLAELLTNFNEAKTSLDYLSEKLSSVKPDEEVEHENDHDHDPSEDEPALSESDKDVENSPYDAQAPKAKKEIRKTVSRLLDRNPKDPKVRKDICEKDDDDNEVQESVEKLNWQEMLLNGTEDGEKILIKEYTTLLRNYKDLKKKLRETEIENDNQFDATLQLSEMKNIITEKDEENRYLREKLELLQGKVDEKEEDVRDKYRDEEIKSIYIEKLPSLSNVEEKIRSEIDGILDDNLEFWLSFSTSIREVQKFRTEVHDLLSEMSKLSDKIQQSGNVNSMKSEAKAMYKHLREIQRGLSLWSDQNASLKNELRNRFASLCSIQETIARTLKEEVEGDEIRFGSHQAAKFQGEIMNMKQENNKVRNELQAALDLVRILQIEVEKMLRQLNQELGIGSEDPENQKRPKVPLRAFLFGTKKKHKTSLFSCMHPNKRHTALKDSTRRTKH